MSNSIKFRFASESDMPAMLSLLVDDVLGVQRESLEEGHREQYIEAFRKMSAQNGNQILLAENSSGVVGMLQITIIPGLSLGGASRANIEGVRVKADLRGRGVGTALMRKAIEIASDSECSMVQLTTNSQRADAKRFYESLGFSPSHIGMKLKI